MCYLRYWLGMGLPERFYCRYLRPGFCHCFKLQWMRNPSITSAIVPMSKVLNVLLLEWNCCRYDIHSISLIFSHVHLHIQYSYIQPPTLCLSLGNQVLSSKRDPQLHMSYNKYTTTFLKDCWFKVCILCHFQYICKFSLSFATCQHNMY